MLLHYLPADIELDFFLACYHNFAATLHQNRGITPRPMKRSYDTTIVTYVLIISGITSDRGRRI